MLHTAYGLVIDAAISLPELPLADPSEQPDVHIVLGPVPTGLEAPLARAPLYEAGADEFLLTVPGVASYHVTADCVTVAPAGPASDHEVRVFLLGSAVGTLLHLRGLLVLHAAAFHTDQGAVLLAGRSGAGKSTLLSALIARGHPMIVDDVCAIDLVDGRPIVLPGYPRTRVWADAADKLAIDTEALVRTRPGMEKFERQLDADFHDQPSPLRTMFVLIPHPEAGFVALDGVSSFEAVLRHTYRAQFLDGLSMRDEHFHMVSAVAAKATIVRALRVRDRFELDELADGVEAQLATS